MPLTETKSTIGTKKMIFVCCPLCGSKTRIKIRIDTVLEKFPLFCPKCRQVNRSDLIHPLTGSIAALSAGISVFRAGSQRRFFQ